MDWGEFFDGAVKLVTAIGVAIVSVMTVWNRHTSIKNSTEIKKTLKEQNTELDTIRNEVVGSAEKAAEVKEATQQVTKAAADVKQAAEMVAQVVAPVAVSSPDFQLPPRS